MRFGDELTPSWLIANSDEEICGGVATISYLGSMNLKGFGQLSYYKLGNRSFRDVSDVKSSLTKQGDMDRV